MAAGFGLRAFLGLAVRVGVALRVFGGMVGHWRGAYTLGSRGKPRRELPTLRRVLKAEWNRAKQLLRLRLSVRLAPTAKERGTIDRVLQLIDERRQEQLAPGMRVCGPGLAGAVLGCDSPSGGWGGAGWQALLPLQAGPNRAPRLRRSDYDRTRRT